MKKEKFTSADAKDLIKGKLSRYFGVAPSEARKEQLYKEYLERGGKPIDEYKSGF